MYFYSLYSKSQKRFNVPFLAIDADDAIAKVSQMVTGSSDPGLILSLSDYELCELGMFDPQSLLPLQVLEDPCSVMVQLHDKLPLPPLLRDKVDKIYGLTVDGGDKSEE